MSQIARDVWIRGIAPFVADDDAKALRETCGALREGVDTTYVYRDRRYRIVPDKCDFIPPSGIKIRHALVINGGEMWYIDPSVVETLTVYYCPHDEVHVWFATNTTWSALRALDLRYNDIFTVATSNRVTLSRRALPVLDTLCVRNASFHLTIPIEFDNLRLRVESKVYVILGGASRLAQLHIGNYSRYGMETPLEIDTVYMADDNGCSLLNGTKHTRVRHLAIQTYNTSVEYPILVDRDALRELTVFSMNHSLVNAKYVYEPINLSRAPNVERVNLAFPGRVTNAPAGCVVRYMTIGETRAMRERIVTWCLEN